MNLHHGPGPCLGCGALVAQAHRIGCPGVTAPHTEPRHACTCGRQDGHHNAWCATLQPDPPPPAPMPAAAPEPSTFRDFLWSLAVAWSLGVLIDHIDVPIAKKLLELAEERERLQKKN